MGKVRVSSQDDIVNIFVNQHRIDVDVPSIHKVISLVNAYNLFVRVMIFIRL